MSAHYYNEFDPYAAAWLRNLISAGHLPAGEVDERSIVDVAPSDLAGYTQCHFFAGIGGWSLAARLAGWPDDRELWTGSAPCQPFSVAGQQRGTDDDRHLWPHFLRLIAARRPAVVFGEQVAVAAGAKREEGPSLKRALESLAREKPGTLESYRQIIADCQPGREHDRGCEEAREAERLGLRFGGLQRAADDANQLGAVRTDGDATQAVWRPEGLGYAFAGSDSAGAGLHDQQCSGDRVRPECDDADVGTGSRHVDHGCAEGQGSGAERELPGAVRSGARAPTTADWLDGVQSDLHALGYTCGAAIVPCCAVDSPHRRDRLWFVADASSRRCGEPSQGEVEQPRGAETVGASDGAMADTDIARASEERQQRSGQLGGAGGDPGDCLTCGKYWDDCTCVLPGPFVGDVADGSGSSSRCSQGRAEIHAGQGDDAGAGRLPSPWQSYAWIIGHDGKARRVGTRIRRVADGLSAGVAGLRAGDDAAKAELEMIPMLAHGVLARVGKLRAFGNAIVPAVAAEVIGAYMDCMPAPANDNKPATAEVVA